MSKWIAEFELEDGDTMPEHMDLEYEGAKIDFRCRPMWIPVTERLPGKGEVVLITNDKGHVRSGQYRGFDYVNRDWWIWRGNRIERVLAWMPLPKPYREEKNEY